LKVLEKYHPEARRLILFRIIYAFMLTVLCSVLSYRQLFEADEYETKERQQGQRRIIRPGARGDVLDRNGELLIGNRANFSAILHMEQLKSEIWEKKLELRNLAYSARDEFNQKSVLKLESFIQRCLDIDHIQKRGIFLTGKLPDARDRTSGTKIFSNGSRLHVEQDLKKGWRCTIWNKENPITNLFFLNAGKTVRVNAAGLFKITFNLDPQGKPIGITKISLEHKGFLDSLLPSKNESSYFFEFSTSGFDLDWESRFSIVEKYLRIANEMTGRNKVLTMKDIKKHWNQRLVMPLEISTDLLPAEYAALVEKLPTQSPIKVQAQSVRHYPQKSLASHILGYVGSGYEANPTGLSGGDLATFEVQGRTGKAGVEKQFDPILRGQDGGDIWRVNPMGYRFERIEKKPSTKGESIQLTIDKDLQSIAENSLQKMVQKVARNRILPDKDWRKTIERRTRKALQGSQETEVRAELLISAFVDAPFPLSGVQASTVAGFKGTREDADRLLRRLYAQGVLAKPDMSKDEYVLAPPMLPPAAAVLLDLESEEILALASKPNYNLEHLTPYISQNSYDEIQRREAWLPRAYHPGYAPASPFKLVTALAGIRYTGLDPDEKLLCEGIYRGMECHVFPGKHGDLSLRDAISQSCNVYFFRCAEKIGHENLIREAKMLGFTDNPNLELPSLRDSPIVPDPTWKREALGVKWTLEDTFNISIGQGGLRQSPLQMACFAAKMAKNKFKFKPTILKNQATQKSEHRLVDGNTSKYRAIVEGMELATTRGTARRCNIKGISVAGKTGTGQWRNRNMELNLAWFIGFAPVEDPKVAIAVLVEGVIPQDQIQGGLTATPVAKDILSAYFDKYNKRLASLQKN
jgi:cell division protein FtsI/penicillin-binding protein 2